MKHPTPYLILVKYENGWTIRAEYETLEVAEVHALDVLKCEYPQDLKVVKDLTVSIKCQGEN